MTNAKDPPPVGHIADAKARKLQHTPGPWHFWTYTDCDGDPRADGVLYEVHCFSTREPTDLHNGHELGSGEEARANARLIAAAPDLLAALQSIASHDLAFITGSVRLVAEEMQRVAIAAIAKATTP